MRFFGLAQALAALGLLSLGTVRVHVGALDLDPSSQDSIKDVSHKLATQLFAQYATNDTKGVHVIGGYPGVLYPPYYWWLCGAMFGTFLDYWHYTGDDTFNSAVREGLIHQFGENNDLMPQNQSMNEGNDDQVFWAFTMMSAAEYGFPDPPSDKPGWLAMTQSVFNQFVRRYQIEEADGNCGGGLRWQSNPLLNGWMDKNTASNGGLFHLSARLALYTGNDTYAKWAEKVFDWMSTSPLLPGDGQIFDITAMDTKPPCSVADKTPWTYNYGIMIAGAAYMYNYTNGADKWKSVLTQFLNHTDQFYPEQLGSVMYEICEYTTKCNTDQLSFKAYFSRWLAVTMQIAPFTHDQIWTRLTHSAVQAAQTCNGPSPKGGGEYQCGSRWYQQGYDGIGGIGPQMTALNTISVLNVDRAKVPYTSKTGGTSQGNAGLGSGNGHESLPVVLGPVTTADRSGASILTLILIAFTLGGAWFISF